MGKAKKFRGLELDCPVCNASLSVDADSGKVSATPQDPDPIEDEDPDDPDKGADDPDLDPGIDDDPSAGPPDENNQSEPDEEGELWKRGTW